MWSLSLRMGSPLTAFCSCQSFRKPLQTQCGIQRVASSHPYFAPFPAALPPGDLRSSSHLCAPVLWCLGVLAGARGLSARATHRRPDLRSLCTRGFPALATAGAVFSLSFGTTLVACAVEGCVHDVVVRCMCSTRVGGFVARVGALCCLWLVMRVWCCWP